MPITHAAIAAVDENEHDGHAALGWIEGSNAEIDFRQIRNVSEFEQFLDRRA